MVSKSRLESLYRVVCGEKSAVEQIAEWQLLVEDLWGTQHFGVLFVTPSQDELKLCVGTRIPSAYLDLCRSYLSRQPIHFLGQEIVWREGVTPSPEATALNVRYYIRLPLYFGDEVIGLLVLGWQVPPEDETSLFGFLQLMRGMLQTFVERTILSHENITLQRLQETSYKISRLVNEDVDLPILLDHIIAEAMNLAGACGARILLVNNEPQQLQQAASYGNTPPRNFPSKVAFGEGMDGQVALTRQSIYTNDYNHYDHAHPVTIEQNFLRSLLGVPLVVRDELIGVLSVHHLFDDSHPEFTTNDVFMLESLASLAAMAIEKSRMRDAIFREHSQLQTMLDHLRMPVMLFDAEQRLVLANPEAYMIAERLSNSAEDPANMGVKELQQLLLNEQIIPANLQTEEAREVNIEGVGEFVMRTAEIVGSGNRTEGYILVGQEITEERELHQTRSELLHLLSHDLGNILGLALGYTTLLLDVPIENEEQQLFVERIYDALNRGKTFIRDVVEIEHARSEGIQLQKPYDVNDALQQIMVGLTDMARVHRQTLTYKVIHPPLQQMLGNVLLIKQAFENLISNAIKYTLDGGTVTVTLDSNITHAIVTIQDTGIGIAPEDLDLIFNRFYRVKSKDTSNIPGSGLGLYLVNWVISSHEGWIEVESEIGKGSTFRVYLTYPDETA